MPLSKPLHALLIEDNLSDAELIQELLSEATADTTSTQIYIEQEETLLGGMRRYSENEGTFDIILLDLGLPDTQGLETFTKLAERASHIPIIVLTGLNDVDLAVETVRRGAQDYLVKGRHDGEILLRAIRYAVERKRSEAKIARLNRLYTVLGKTNEAMWRIREPKKLYNETCRIAVEDGLFRMAWIGKTEPDTRLVKPIAYWGFEDGYLDSITISAEDVPEGRGPTGTALREGRYDICNDYEHDPRLQIWRDEALKRDYRSSAAFPLKIGTRVIGALTLYSNEQLFFDDEEIQLIERLSDDIAFAIEFIEREEELMQRGEMLDLANDAIMIVDLDGTITYWNKGAERLYGWARGEAVGQNVHEFLQTEYPRSLDDALSALYRDGGWDGELIYRTRDKTRLIVESHWTLYRDSDGKPSAIFEINNDVTDWKRADKAIREYARYQETLNSIIKAGNKANDLQTMLSSMLDTAIELMGFDGGVIYFLNEVQRCMELQYQRGISPEFLKPQLQCVPITQKNAAIIYKGEPLFSEDYVIDALEGFKHAGNLARAAIPLIARDSVIGLYAVFSRRPHRFTPKERELLLTIGREAANFIAKMQTEEALKKAHDELEQKVEERTRDLQGEIEEHKMTEEQLRATTEELENLTQELRRSNKELEQFAYIASHDLQEPLRTVTSSIGLLENLYKDKLGEEADTFINYAVNGTKQMQQLIKDLLAYSRVTSRGEAFKPVHCEGVVQHAIDNLKAAIEESDVKITLPEATLPMVMGDTTQLVQLFQNLISNAIKFQNEQPPEIQIDVKRDAKQNRWQFSIKDNGIGIDMQYADKVFTIFQRLHTTEQYPGTGLGLALCKKIVERHSGKIWVESKLGEGSTFYFTLPFQADI